MELSETAEEREIMRGVAEIFAALGDPTRLAVMVRLAAGGTYSIANLAEGTGLSRQAITKHLKVLEDSGLVLSGAHGREKLYEMDAEPLQDPRACLDMLLAHLDQTLARIRSGEAGG